MSAQIFISYRREDTASEAGRICSAIYREFGEDSVFMDTSSIQAGAKWPEEIQSALKAAETIIVVIGPEWLRVGSNEWGQRRIDQENDWVRQELSLALNENKSVIPVLVRGARMPPADALPECINTLPHRQKLDIRNDYWDHDIELLLVRLPRPPSKQQEANDSKLGPYPRNSPAGRTPLGEEKLRKVVKRNFEHFFLILANPRRFIVSINHPSNEQLIPASIFAAMMSVLNLVITLPLSRLLRVQTESVSYVIADTILTFAFWFLSYGLLTASP